MSPYPYEGLSLKKLVSFEIVDRNFIVPNIKYPYVKEIRASLRVVSGGQEFWPCHSIEK